MGIIQLVGEAGRESPGPAGLTIGGSDTGRRSRSRVRAHGPPLREGAAFVSPGWYLDRCRVVSARLSFGSAVHEMRVCASLVITERSTDANKQTQKQATLSGVVGGHAVATASAVVLSASLILAQEQRWRRA